MRLFWIPRSVGSNLILQSKVDSACISFFGRAGSVGSQQSSFAIIHTWCHFWLISIVEMKKCDEILAKIFFWSICLKLTEKFNATLAKTQNKGDKKLTEKRKAVFVFYFVGFYLNLTKKWTKNFGKDRLFLDPNIADKSWGNVIKIGI